MSQEDNPSDVQSSDEDVEESEDLVQSNRAVVRAEYRKIIAEVGTKEEELVNIENEHLLGYMHHNDELFSQVATPQEAVMDAMLLKNLSRMCRQQAEQMTANIAQFRYEEYADRLVSSMCGEGGRKLAKRKWVMLGQQAKLFFKRSPVLTYMFGALDTTPPPPKEKKVRETKSRQAVRTSDLKETAAVVLAEAEKSENQTEQLVTHVFKCLVIKYKEAGRQPVNYFSFVIDPRCFGKSIENMFHVSFLVKEGKAQIFICESTGLPHIMPKSSKSRDKGDEDQEKNQVVMNISMEDWQRMIDELSIKEPMINPIS